MRNVCMAGTFSSLNAETSGQTLVPCIERKTAAPFVGVNPLSFRWHPA
jgi:hypothetical protein